MAKRRPSGDGMVRKRDDGRWEGRIVVGHKENGDSIFRYIYADTQKELTAKLRQNIDAYQGIDLTEQSQMALSEWLDQWLSQMSVTLRPNTLERYRQDMNNHVISSLGKKRLTQITAQRQDQPPSRSEPRAVQRDRPQHPHQPSPCPPHSKGAGSYPDQSRR